MPERPRERGLGPPEFEREQAESHDDERNARPGEHEQRKPTEERGEAAERDEHPDNGMTLSMPFPPLAQAVAGGHATLAPNSSPSFRSR